MISIAAATQAHAQVAEVKTGAPVGISPGPVTIELTDVQALAQQMRVTPEVAQQILNLSDDKDARSPAQIKISSDFIYAARMYQGLPAAPGVQTLATGLTPDAQGCVLAEIHSESAAVGAAGQALRTAIGAAGGTIVNDVGNTILVNVPLLQIEPLAARSDVDTIGRYFPPRLVGSRATLDRLKSIRSHAAVPYSDRYRKKRLAEKIDRARVAFLSNRLDVGHNFTSNASTALENLLVNSTDYDGTSNTGTIGEGVTVHAMAAAFKAYGVNGTGLRIGVMSDGDAFLATSQSNNDLPPTDSSTFGTGTTPSVTVVVDDTQSTNVSQGGPSGNTGEGTAMMEIVHDMAPGAKIFFATADNTSAQFAKNILLLRFKYNCDIIVDDVSYNAEAPFSDDNVAQAVNQVTSSGGLYFSSAGNEGHISQYSAPNPPHPTVASGNSDPSFAAGTWEGDFVAGATNPTIGGATRAGVVNVFNNGKQNPSDAQPYGNPYNISDYPATSNGSETGTGTVFLYWSDKTLGGTASNPTTVTGATNDYDLYVTSSDGTTLMSSGTTTQNGAANSIPMEQATLQFANSAQTDFARERIYILKKSSASPCTLHLTTNGSLFYDAPSMALTTNGDIRGHAAAAQAFAVAATPATTDGSVTEFGPYPNSYDSTDVSEYFTSDGPRSILWNVTGGPNITLARTPTIAANGYTLPISIPVFNQIGSNLLSGTSGSSTVRLKPELTAADGVTSGAAFTSGSELNPFYGTSAAAPHAASIAAVVKSYSGTNSTGTTVNGKLLSVSEMRTVLTSSTIDIEATGFDATTGYGIVMPVPAIAFLQSFCAPASVSALATTQTTATITWTTNLPSTSVVNYDLANDNTFSTVSNSTPTLNHSVTITGLTPGAAYRYRVTSVTPTASVRFDDTVDRSFATVPSSKSAGTPQIAVTGIVLATGGTSASVTLTNSGTGSATHVKITSATLNSVGTTSTVPVAVGTIAASGTGAATLAFPAQTSGARVVLTVAGTDDSGETFTSSSRVTIP